MNIILMNRDLLFTRSCITREEDIAVKDIARTDLRKINL
jgi:hypothetical protein